MANDTFFRFALQTADRRLSEIWSFFGSKREECLFATRSSINEWLKVSFHQSGACHLKVTTDKHTKSSMKTFGWRYPEITGKKPVHAMRVIYDLDKQAADFPYSDRVKIVISKLPENASIYLDVFLAFSKDGEFGENRDVAYAHCLGGQRWVYFTLMLGPPQSELPEGISGMIFHLGEKEIGADGESITLMNSTGLFYCAPESRGTFLVLEKSFDRFFLK